MSSLLAREGMLDRLAIGLSGICLAHCIATSLILALAASAGGMLFHPLVHEAGLGIAILLGALALGRGAMLHGQMLPVAVGSLGLGVMMGALTLPHDGSEALFTIVGVALVAYGHHLNSRAAALG